jgi:7-carboxy-7-deazaguanine synthase
MLPGRSQNSCRLQEEHMTAKTGPINPPMLEIAEIFHSIQGESTHAGLPCTFVRLAGCNLECLWCDTKHACGERWTVGAVLKKVELYGCALVEITGGEPLLQPACPELARRLLDAGHTVLLETNGSQPIDALPPEVIRIMDLKCPDSGMTDRMHWPNMGMLNPARDEVKFVVASRADYEWGRDVIRKYALETRCACILISPVWGRVNLEDLAAWILEDRLPVRFQLQLHKLIWGPDATGV